MKHTETPKAVENSFTKIFPFCQRQFAHSVLFSNNAALRADCLSSHTAFLTPAITIFLTYLQTPGHRLAEVTRCARSYSIRLEHPSLFFMLTSSSLHAEYPLEDDSKQPSEQPNESSIASFRLPFYSITPMWYHSKCSPLHLASAF